MEIMDLIAQIFEVCIIPLMGILTAYFVKWIGVKTEELKEETKNEKTEKYLDMLNNTITNCVIATTQTYVEALKKQGSFTEEAQKQAFKLTYEAVMAILTDDAQEYLNEVIKDLNAYITNKIESGVVVAKQQPVA
jgi:nitrogen regulatory protein PII-like uncharacterized protein